MIVAWVIYFGYVLLFSLGIGFACKHAGESGWKRACLPFVSFYYVNRLTRGGYTVFGIRIKNWGNASLLCTAVAGLFSLLYESAAWFLAPEDVAALRQIALVPIVLVAVVFYLNCIAITLRTMYVFRVRFRGDVWFCALFVVLPAVLMYIRIDESKLRLA